MTMNRAMWDAGLRPWQEYNGNLEAFGRDFRNYFDNLPAEQRVWAVVLSSAIYEYFVRYLSAAAGVDPLKEFRIIIIPPQMVTNVRLERCKPTWWQNLGTHAQLKATRASALRSHKAKKFTRTSRPTVGVMEDFINYPKTYRSLVKAMIEACQCAANRKPRRGCQTDY